MVLNAPNLTEEVRANVRGTSELPKKFEITI